MKTVNREDFIKWMPIFYVLDVAFVLFVGILYTAFIVTGVVYPIHPSEQQLLKAWGIESIFMTLIALEYIIPIVFAIPITLWLIKRFELWEPVSTVLIPIWIVLDAIISLGGIPLLIKNIVLYPILGWIIGQTATKMIVLLTKVGKSNVRSSV